FEGSNLNHNCVFPSISIKVHLKKSIRTNVLFVKAEFNILNNRKQVLVPNYVPKKFEFNKM
ncbi:hypothetical protein HMPREF1383_02024, partial [Enterococcus faecium V689]